MKQQWPKEIIKEARNLRAGKPQPSYAKIAMILCTRLNLPALSRFTVREWCRPETANSLTRAEYLSRAYEWANLGERCPHAKLTNAIVAAIRARYVPRNRQHSAAAIARDMGIPTPTVRDVVQYRTWSHLA